MNWLSACNPKLRMPSTSARNRKPPSVFTESETVYRTTPDASVFWPAAWWSAVFASFSSTPARIWETTGTAHNDLVGSHNKMAKTDKPISGLIKDLQAKGLLDSTLVIWSSEF